MTINRNYPKKPYMIYREDGSGNDFALIHKTLGMFKAWVDWDGSKFATRDEAQALIDKLPELGNARVIEVLEEVRVRTGTADE